jgi:hypothetical protein
VGLPERELYGFRSGVNQPPLDLSLPSITSTATRWPSVKPAIPARSSAVLRTRSALVGAIWQIQDNIAVDFAVRGARVNDHTAGEIRAGVTFAFGVTKGPDLLSGLFATARH